MIKGRLLFEELSHKNRFRIKSMTKTILLQAFFFLFIAPIAAFGQGNTHSWEQYYYQLAELEDMENDTWEATYDILCDLEGNKMDINSVTKEDLERLLFLTPAQIEELCEYVYRYAPLRSLAELAMIESLDATRRNLLSCFVYVPENSDKKAFPSLKNILKYGKNELVATAKIPTYDRKGDKQGYLGYKYKHWFRYTYKYGEYFQAGVTGSQDAGEPFFEGRNKQGYDYYSFYVIARKLGKWKTIALGRYRLRFGMGLVMNNDFSFGKMSSLALNTSATVIHAHSSRSEANYLQGIAATYTVAKGLDMTAFLSYRKLDATPISGTDSVSTIVKTGYHRTINEMNHKHNVGQAAAGVNLRYFNKGFHIGISGVFAQLDKTLSPNTKQAFRRYYLSGKHFSNAGINYGYNGHSLSISGETAVDDKLSMATINRVSYQVSSRWSLTALQRFYSYKFRTFFGECFSDGRRVQNESGVYLGTTWSPLTGLSIMAYTDYVYYPWAKYQISFASHSWDNLVAATYQKGSIQVNARYRIRLRQRDNEDKTALQDFTEQRARLSVGYSNDSFSATLQGDICHSYQTTRSFGYMLSGRVQYSYRWLTAYASLGYFDTDDYASRLYTYEKGLLYTFAFPMLYGQGIRYSANLRAQLSNNLLLIAKVGTTKYFDRSTISSSYQQINGSSMTDIEAQIKWKF